MFLKKSIFKKMFSAENIFRRKTFYVKRNRAVEYFHFLLLGFYVCLFATEISSQFHIFQVQSIALFVELHGSS